MAPDHSRLETTPPEVELSRLSRELYVEFLEEATARDVEFVRFAELRPGERAPSGRFVALRHDIDFAPEYSLEMAELERDAGVVSTFFALVDGHFYNPASRETVAALRRMRELGHEVGLHFARSTAVHDDLAEEVALRVDLLSRLLDSPVHSYSQHDPVNAGRVAFELPSGYEGCADADRLERAHDLMRVSDSAMKWRDHTFMTALESDRNLCLVAHAHTWLHPQDDYVALIRDLESQEVERLRGNYDEFVAALPSYYERRRVEGL